MDEDALGRGELKLSRQLQQHGARDIHVSQRLDQIDNSALQFDAGQSITWSSRIHSARSGRVRESSIFDQCYVRPGYRAPDCPNREQPDWGWLCAWRAIFASLVPRAGDELFQVVVPYALQENNIARRKKSLSRALAAQHGKSLERVVLTLSPSGSSSS